MQDCIQGHAYKLQERDRNQSRLHFNYCVTNGNSKAHMFYRCLEVNVCIRGLNSNPGCNIY